MNMMNIEFLKDHTLDGESGNITFHAKVDGKPEPVPCIVSDQVLQDLLPDNAKEETDQLFLQYRADLENIAKQKILSSEFNWEKVLITKADMP